MFVILLNFVLIDAVWIDYDPLDGSVETIDWQCHTFISKDKSTENSETKLLVRFDDGWDVYRRPKAEKSSASALIRLQPKSRKKEYPNAHINKTKKRIVQSLHQSAQHIIQESLSISTQKPTTKIKHNSKKYLPESQRETSTKATMQIPTKKDKHRTQKPRHVNVNNLSSLANSEGHAEETRITAKKKHDKIIHVYAIDTTQYKDRFIANFESELVSTEHGSFFILNSMPSNINKAQRLNIEIFDSELLSSIGCICDFMVHIMSWQFPFKMKQMTQWLITSLIRLSKLRDDIFRSIHKKLKQLSSNGKSSLVAQIVTIYEIACIADPIQRNKKFKQKEESLEKLIHKEFEVVACFFELALRRLYDEKVSEYNAFKNEQNAWLWDQYFNNSEIKIRQNLLDKQLRNLTTEIVHIARNRQMRIKKDLTLNLIKEVGNDGGRLKALNTAIVDVLASLMYISKSMRTFFVCNMLLKWKQIPEFDGRDIHIVVKKNAIDKMMDVSLEKMGYSQHIKAYDIGMDRWRLFVKVVRMGFCVLSICVFFKFMLTNTIRRIS